jgi:pimeloyl-ACP methyl ester carboxylesterase
MMKRNVQLSFAVLAWAALLLLPQATAIQAQNESAPPLPPPGKLVDVGGWRLHLHCTGEARAGQPTVILEPGIGDFSVEWSLVQPGIAKFARVCSYDRAGDGWSDWGPHPRTFRQIVYELHTLLDKAGVKPPFVLVGQSYGGWLVRLYALTYPSDVVGMALVDVGADDPWRMTNGKLARSSELVKGEMIPAVKTSGPLRVSDIPPEALRQMKAGAQSLVPHTNDPPRDKLPPEAQRMRAWARGQLGHIAAGVNPFEMEELAALRAEQAKSEYPFGDKPLIVLTRGIPEESGPNGKAMEEERRRNHAAVAKRSRRGKLIVATRSGHHIQMDEPELVIQSIREVVDAASQKKSESPWMQPGKLRPGGFGGSLKGNLKR